MKKILIIDYHSASNRGDAAILEGVLFSLKNIYPDATFEVVTQYPLAAQFINGVDAYPNKIYPFTGFLSKKSFALFYLLLLAFIFGKFSIKFPFFDKLIDKFSLRSFLYADLIVSTGGSFLNDFYYPYNLARFWNIIFAKLLRKKVVIYAQSIGPINKFFLKIVSRFIFSKVDCIILRDQHSYQLLRSLSIKNRHIYVTADAAFSMPTFSDKPLSEARLETIPLLDSKNAIKVSISLRDWPFFKNISEYLAFKSVIVDLCEWLVKEKGVILYFVSTCTPFAGYKVDDRLVAYEVVSSLSLECRQKTFVLSGEYTPYELMHIYSNMYFHIGMRMHSCVLALLANIPVISLAYEFKSEELMKMLSLEEFVFSVYSLKLDELKCAIDSLIRNRFEIISMIREKVSYLRKKSMLSSKIVSDVVG